MIPPYPDSALSLYSNLSLRRWYNPMSWLIKYQISKIRHRACALGVIWAVLSMLDLCILYLVPCTLYLVPCAPCTLYLVPFLYLVRVSCTWYLFWYLVLDIWFLYLYFDTIKGTLGARLQTTVATFFSFFECSKQRSKNEGPEVHLDTKMEPKWSENG